MMEQGHFLGESISHWSRPYFHLGFFHLFLTSLAGKSRILL
jgi:hypothetical protein